MTNNKHQTAVDILCGKLAMKLGIPQAITFYIDHQEEIREAKEMEKERIETELVSHVNGHYIVKAIIWVGDRQVATGLADEHTEQKGVNARNALENAETSAIGRADC